MFEVEMSKLKAAIHNYTVSSKIYPLMVDNNFGKCGPIFTILSAVDSSENSL